MTVKEFVNRLPPGLAIANSVDDLHFMNIESWLPNGDGLVGYIEKDGGEWYLSDLGSTASLMYLKDGVTQNDFDFQRRISSQTGAEFKNSDSRDLPLIVRVRLGDNPVLDLMNFCQASLLFYAYCEAGKLLRF